MQKENGKTIFIAGAGGFVGKALVDELVTKNFTVKALVRQGSPESPAPRRNLTIIQGDICNPATYAEHLTGVEIAVNLVGIKRGNKQAFQSAHVDGVQQFVAALRNAGVKRLIHFSSSDAINSELAKKKGYAEPNLFQVTKWEGEEAVRKSGLDYTIFRPSLIHGSDSCLIKRLLPYTRRWPIIVPGSGEFPYFPIYIDDVLKAVTAAFNNDTSIGGEYDLGGPEMIFIVDMMEQMSNALGLQRRFKVHIPLSLLKLWALTRGLLVKNNPYTPGQLTMLSYGRDCHSEDFIRDFKLTPRTFAETFKKYAQDMR